MQKETTKTLVGGLKLNDPAWSALLGGVRGSVIVIISKKIIEKQEFLPNCCLIVV